jgi:hypothetical protein
VNREEAFAVIAVMQAAYPSSPWTEGTVLVWVDELLPLAAAEGMGAAREMYRNHNFPTVANFRAELATLRERRADTAGPNFNRPALMSAERVTPPDEAKSHIAQLQAQLRAMPGPLARGLARALPRPMVSLPRADETYFHPDPKENA